MPYKDPEKRKAAWRESYHRNHSTGRERAEVRRKAAQERNRAFVWLYLQSRCCVRCGESDSLVLEFDHIDPETKRAEVSYLVHVAASLSSIEEEIGKCQVLCCNCHRRLTKQQQLAKLKPEEKDVAAVAQSVERLVVAEEVAGSKPVRRPGERRL